MNKLTICDAIYQNQSFETIKELIDGSDKINSLCSSYCYPLHNLLHSKRPDIVKILELLIIKNVNLNVKSFYLDRTGLEILCSKATPENSQCFRMMLENGANAYDNHKELQKYATSEIKEILDNHYKMNLLKAIENRSSFNKIEMTLDYVDNVNFGCGRHIPYANPLHLLIFTKHHDMCNILELFIHKGVDMNIFCKEMNSMPLEMLMLSENPEELKFFEMMLKNGANPMLCHPNFYVMSNFQVRKILETHTQNDRIYKLEKIVTDLNDLINKLLSD